MATFGQKLPFEITAARAEAREAAAATAGQATASPILQTFPSVFTLPIFQSLFGTALTETQRTRPAASTPAALQAALAAIPDANDGDVVYAHYHQSLKNALLMVSSYVFDQVLTQDVTLSFSPALMQLAGQTPPWTLAEGEAQQGAQAAVIGWMPVDLPDGVRIQSIAVHGTATSGKSVGTITIRLKRRPLQSTAGADEIVNVQLQGVNPAFGQPASVTQVDKQTVDRFAYGYHVTAEVAGAATDAGIRLFGFEIACTRW